MKFLGSDRYIPRIQKSKVGTDFIHFIIVTGVKGVYHESNVLVKVEFQRFSQLNFYKESSYSSSPG